MPIADDPKLPARIGRGAPGVQSALALHSAVAAAEDGATPSHAHESGGWHGQRMQDSRVGLCVFMAVPSFLSDAPQVRFEMTTTQKKEVMGPAKFSFNKLN